MGKKIYFILLTLTFFTSAICQAEAGACYIKWYDSGEEGIRCDDRITAGECRQLVKYINNELKKDKKHGSGATLIGFIPGGTCP